MEIHRIALKGRSLLGEISGEAASRLRESDRHLRVEMELNFSWLIRKRVRIVEAPAEPGDVSLGEGLSVGFRPVMTRACGVEEVVGEPPLTDFPVARADAFVPHWLLIGLHQGELQGAFGYCGGMS